MENPQLLIVEDEALLAMNLAEEIKKLGYPEPFLACTGEQAIRVAEQEAIDIILMDVNLSSSGSQLNGIETAERIKAIKHIPVIFITAYPESETTATKAIKEPFWFLPKPFRISDIDSTIHFALHRYKLLNKFADSLSDIDSLLNEIPCAVIIFDEARIHYLNTKAERLSGKTHSKTTEVGINELFQLELKGNPFNFLNYVSAINLADTIPDLPLGLKVKNGAKKTEVTGTVFVIPTQEGEILYAAIFNPKTRSVEPQTMQLERKSLKDVVEQRIMISNIKRNLSAVSGKKPVQAEISPDRMIQFKTLMHDAFRELLEAGYSDEIIHDVAHQFFKESVSPFQILDTYLSILPELLFEYPDRETEVMMNDCRMFSFQLFILLSEMYHQKIIPAKAVESTLDKTGLPLNLDASEDELQSFFLNTADLLLDLNVKLIALENQHDHDSLDTAFRIAHTIKGNSGIIKHHRMNLVVHTIETIMDRIRSGKQQITPDLISLLLKSLDILQELLKEVQTGKQSGVAVSSILDQLAAFTMTESHKTENQKSASFVSGQGAAPSDLKLAPDSLEKIRLKRVQGMFAYTITLTAASDIPSVTLMLAQRDLCLLGEVIAQSPEESELGSETDYNQLCLLLLTRETPARIQQVIHCQMDISEARIDEWKETKASPEPAAKPEQKDTPKELEKQASGVRVPFEKLDRMVDYLGELVLVQSRVIEIAREVDHPDSDSFCQEMARLTNHLRDIVMNIRMIPIEATFSKYRRVVRDLAQDLKKEIHLELKGTDTQLDKTIVEKLDDCLMHLVRNSIDHGIEAPQDRIRAGKPAAGTIGLSASHKGGIVEITIVDDGKGLDKTRIREKALQHQLITPNTVISDREIYNLLFLPGFSTAENVTTISGRGVGMDVIRREIESLRGTIVIESETGKYTRILLSIPLTLTEGLLVACHEDRYVIPMAMVDECLELNTENTDPAERRNLMLSRGEWIPYIRLRDFFNYPPLNTGFEEAVIVKTEDMRVGIVADHILGQYQTVIKPLGKLYQDAQGLSGATVMGDGTIALILDIPKLVHTAIQTEVVLVGQGPST